MNRLHRLWTEEDGILSFEWTLLLTLLTIGIVAGLAAARDAIIDELGDVAEAAQAFDQSYSLSDFDVPGIFDNNPSIFLETPADQFFLDCDRTAAPAGQSASSDVPS
jgi:Flp pilus assembly pilin Flp